MIQLPKNKIDPELTKDLCKCRPICKSRRREWLGVTLKPSSELMIERQPVPECIRKWPKLVQPNGPCPLFGKTKRLYIREKYVFRDTQKKVRICPARIDDVVDTTYLEAAIMAKKNGALDLVKTCCPFCMCGKCCGCGGSRNYLIDDPDRNKKRRDEMREFDNRVKKTYQEFRVMYL